MNPTKYLLCVLPAIAFINVVQAQESLESIQPFQEDSSKNLEMVLRAVETIKPFPATTPTKPGNFYTFQNGEAWPPLPGNTMNLSFWDLGDGFYLLDDRAVNYVEIRAKEAEEGEETKTGAVMARASFNSSSSWGGVYLTNFVTAFPSNQNASFDIAGGTNYVPYDIWRTTELSNQISQSQWTWLGIGYTSNRYTFTNQPSGQAFYALAKPQKTMVVGWGNNSVGQCDVAFGRSNAIAAVGGGGQSLALLNNGTVGAWGQNSYGQGTAPTNLAGVTMIAAGWYHNVALLTNGNVTA